MSWDDLKTASKAKSLSKRCPMVELFARLYIPSRLVETIGATAKVALRMMKHAIFRTSAHRRRAHVEATQFFVITQIDLGVLSSRFRRACGIGKIRSPPSPAELSVVPPCKER